MKLLELAEKLSSGRAALITSFENRLYFTEFASSNGYLIVTPEESLFITDSRYIEAAKSLVVDCTVVLQDKTYEQIISFLKEKNIREVLIEAGSTSVLECAKLKSTFSDFELNYSDELDKHSASLRRVKTLEEKEKLIRAQCIAEAAFEKTLRIIKPGVSERDIAAELEYNMRKLGADGVSFDTIAITGVNTSKPHGVPGDTLVSSGDFVTMDFGALYKGYHSDTTRTVAVGNVTDEMKKVYDIVLEAQLAGVAALKSGVTASSVDGVCRDIISSYGYGSCFGHGTGHGVGIEIHELPYVSPKSDDVLVSGNVVTIEPGIYIESKFGVRIEDTLFVTEDGSENFVTLKKDLIVL